LGGVIDDNFKLTDLDGKMTLWGNFCPNLPHQELNSLEMLAALKVTHHITGKERYNAAYHMLIDRYHYDDRAINAKIVFPPEWRNVGMIIMPHGRCICSCDWKKITLCSSNIR
jgi:hypothetical protein